MTESEHLAAQIDALVDEYRPRCLWFLRSDFYPRTLSERLRILGYIERAGDVAGYRRASALRQCLSRSFSDRSVA